MPTLCLGGTFDPIHHGHLIGARAVAEARGFDRVLVIPNARPPHKDFEQITASEHRLAMCRLAVKGSDLFAVSDIEISGKVSGYTLDTVRALKQGGVQDICWLIGSDTVTQLPSWHEPLSLLREVQLMVMARPGASIDWTKLGPAYSALIANVVQTPLIDISATDIRRRVASGLCIDYLTPPLVREYIHFHSLYGA